jgi:PAS domain S-box-containing protein
MESIGNGRNTEYIEMLLDKGTDTIVYIDVNAKLHYVSNAVYQQRGFTPEEAASQPLEDILTPSSYSRAMQALKEEIETDNNGANNENTRSSRVLELEMIKRDGTTIWTETTFTFVRDDAGSLQGFLGVIRDISSRKTKEEIREQLMKQNYRETVEGLVAGTAHHFNNLLTVVLGNLQFVKDAAEQADEMQDELGSIDAIECATAELQDITSKLMAFGEKEMLFFHDIDINEAVKEIEDFLKDMINGNIDLEIAFDENAGSFKGDKSKFKNMLLELTINASKAMPGGGLITIRTIKMELNEDECDRIEGANPGTYECVMVKDNGRGIPEKSLQKVFNPFYTTDKCPKNKGLGLSMIKGSMKQHKGFVKVRSAPEKGTAFILGFPTAT